MELKANDLRIGNLITLNDKVRQRLWEDKITAISDYFKIETIWNDGDVLVLLDDESVELDLTEIEPIPLTEERLLKFGFKNNTYPKEKYFLQDFEYNIFNKQVSICKMQITNIDIKFVHSLQNLYHALTGEELILKNN